MKLNELIKQGFFDCCDIVNVCELNTKDYKCSDIVKFNEVKNTYDKDFKEFTTEKVGVYIFYLNEEEILYVGKSDKSKGFYMYDRLKQHFQKSQKGLRKKLLLEFKSDDAVVKKFEQKICLKVLILDVDDVNRIEHFLISTLKPKFNDK